MTSSPILDIALGIPILLWGFKGFKNGLVKEALGLVGLILAIFLSFSYMEEMHNLLLQWVKEDTAWLALASAGIVFFGIMAITQLIIFALNKSLEAAAMNGLNRLLGMGFGVLKSAIILSLILMMMAGFNLPEKTVRGKSSLYPWVLPVASQTYDFITNAWPGASSFDETMRKTMDENNPLRKIMQKPASSGN